MQTTRTAELSAVASLGIARAGIDVAAASLTAAEAQVTFAQAVLDNYTLRAPYDALVVARNLQLGAMPVPGQTVLTLVDPATIWVLGYVDERLAGGLAVGQRAAITLRSEAGRRYPGHVARIEIQSDAVNEERLVEIAFDAIPRDIHLAEQAEVVITTGRIDRAVLVPQTSVAERRAGRGTVWTIQDGRLARREVTVGAPLLDGRLPIIDGLADDIRVVISPATGLRAGRAAVIAEKASQ
jgi:HlyD family secretion protein